MSIEICASKHLVVMGTYYPHMPIGKVWICRLLFVCMFFCNFVFVRLRISLLRITLAASNFSRWFMGVLGRESPILGIFAPQKPKIRRIVFVSFLLSTHANRQGVDISFTVCFFLFVFLCVCTVTDFSVEDKTSGVKFCTVVYRCSGQGISHFGELCSPRSPESDVFNVFFSKSKAHHFLCFF